MLDLDQAIRERHSTRMFLPTLVPRDLVEEALALAQCAPSNSNIQPWHMVLPSGEPRDRLVAALLDDAKRRPHGSGDRRGLEELRLLHDRLRIHGVRVEFTADHVLTEGVYFFDPDGNRLEIFAQEMTPAVGKQYLHAAHIAEDVMTAGSQDVVDISGDRRRYKGPFSMPGLERPDFTQDLPRELLPTRAKEGQSDSGQKP